MRNLLLSLAVFLTGCSSSLTIVSPPVPDALRQRCPDIIADPLTTGDQFDMSRALVQATQYGKACSARLDALVDAIDVRDQIMATVKTQLEKR